MCPSCFFTYMNPDLQEAIYMNYLDTHIQFMQYCLAAYVLVTHHQAFIHIKLTEILRLIDHFLVFIFNQT